MSFSALSFWNKFQEVNRFTDPRRIDDQAWAIDEVTERYLDRLADKSLTEVEDLTKQFWKEVWNKKKKYRRRRQFLLTRFPNESRNVDMPEPSKSAIDESRYHAGLHTAELLEFVKSRVNDREWDLLVRSANEIPLDELSAEWGVPVGTLKSRLSRCRQRLRSELGYLIEI